MLTETEKAMSSSELRYLIAAQALAQKKPVVKQTDIVNQLRVTKVSAPGTALRTKTWTGRKEGIMYTRPDPKTIDRTHFFALFLCFNKKQSLI